jgi:hypothetical protein
MVYHPPAQARCRVASQDGPLTFLNVIDDMNNQGCGAKVTQRASNLRGTTTRPWEFLCHGGGPAELIVLDRSDRPLVFVLYSSGIP